MNEEQSMRLECLRLAASVSVDPAELMRIAKEMYEWLTAGK